MRQYSFLFILVVLLGLIFSLSAQDYPDTLWIKVTFYDFHADGSNPEFEPAKPRITGAVKKNMVANTLSADRKPVLGTAPYFNFYIDKWFRPWKEGDFNIPVYTDPEGKAMTPTTVGYDTAFKNIVIEDSLPFIHTGGGMYAFERSGTPDFFWLDGKGFGNEPKGEDHNFSFAMELHTTFTFKKGMSFEFMGDDDVWAFINGKLAMDLGGIHGSKQGTIALDKAAADYGLVEGKTFPFDFFYVERHVTRSTIKVMTNLFTPEVNVRFYPKEGTPETNGNNVLNDPYKVLSGEAVTVYAHVFDSSEWKPEWDKLVTWELTDSNNKTTSGTVAQNGAIVIPSGKANTEYRLTVKFTNPDDPTHKEHINSIRIRFGVGKPYQITFQKNMDSTQIVTSPLTSLTIGQTEKDATLYAVVRDSAGYFIRFATNAAWNSSNTSAATVSPEKNAAYKGIIKKVENGTTTVTASENGLKPASIEVSVAKDPTIITVTPSSNPVIPGTTIPSEIRTHFEPVITSQKTANGTHQTSDNGVIIAIYIKGTPLKPLVGQSLSYGKARLYDAMGNIVRNDLEVYKTANDTDYGIYWDLRNKNNRLVGPGTYLAEFSVKNQMDEDEMFSLKIGVKQGP